jgi:hypothetical protein
MNELVLMFNKCGYVVVCIELLPYGQRYVEYMDIREIVDNFDFEVYHITFNISDQIERGEYCAVVI